MCFPYIFKGALSVKAKEISFAMQKAAAYAIADLALEPIPADIKETYKLPETISFGPNYIVPMPLDKRLLEKVSTAVADAASET